LCVRSGLCAPVHVSLHFISPLKCSQLNNVNSGSVTPPWTDQLQKLLEHMAVKSAQLFCKDLFQSFCCGSLKVPFVLDTYKFTLEHWALYMNIMWCVILLWSIKKNPGEIYSGFKFSTETPCKSCQ
jgi:hypothetical protein